MTHDMIRALSSEERAFFVENMIGDLLTLGREDVRLQKGGESSLSSALGEDVDIVARQGEVLI